MQERFTKQDWTLFKAKIGDWQEAYMDRLNRGYIELLNEDNSPSEKFWKLDKRIREDKRSPGVQIQLRRSDFIYQIVRLIGDGVIDFEDLADFSDGLREVLNVFLNGSFD